MHVSQNTDMCYALNGISVFGLCHKTNLLLNLISLLLIYFYVSAKYVCTMELTESLV